MTQINDTWENIGDLVRDQNGRVVRVTEGPSNFSCNGCVYDGMSCENVIAGKHVSKSIRIECITYDIIFKHVSSVNESQRTITI